MNSVESSCLVMGFMHLDDVSFLLGYANHNMTKHDASCAGLNDCTQKEEDAWPKPQLGTACRLSLKVLCAVTCCSSPDRAYKLCATVD